MDFNPKVVLLLIIWAAVGLIGIWMMWTTIKKEGEIVIVLTKQPTRIVVVNSVVGRKIAEYLTAAWTMRVGDSTPAMVERMSEAYRQLVMSGLDADTLKAILAEAGAGITIGKDNISTRPPMSTGIKNDETGQGKASD